MMDYPQQNLFLHLPLKWTHKTK